MAIGHHLNDRGHIIEKKKNRYTGEEEENQEFINLDDGMYLNFKKNSCFLKEFKLLKIFHLLTNRGSRSIQ